jgi:hypothetical protein
LELTTRDILPAYFFIVIGLNAHVDDLVHGDKAPGAPCNHRGIAASPRIVLQNYFERLSAKD